MELYLATYILRMKNDSSGVLQATVFVVHNAVKWLKYYLEYIYITTIQISHIALNAFKSLCNIRRFD